MYLIILSRTWLASNANFSINFHTPLLQVYYSRRRRYRCCGCRCCNERRCDDSLQRPRATVARSWTSLFFSLGRPLHPIDQSDASEILNAGRLQVSSALFRPNGTVPFDGRNSNDSWNIRVALLRRFQSAQVAPRSGPSLCTLQYLFRNLNLII